MNKDRFTISKEVAKTIGLDQAVVLEILNNLLSESQTNKFSLEHVEAETSFWDKQHFNLVLESLVAKGLVKYSHDQISLVKNLTPSKTAPEYSELNIREDKELNTNWSPEPELLEQVSEYGIPDDFALSFVEEFKYQSAEKSERNHSWGIKFLRYVIKKWREKEISNHKESKRKPISSDWYPDDEASQILVKSGVNQEFIEKEIPEFILYWSERNEVSDIWNSKFISHIRRQWARSENLIENNELPCGITQDWKPNEDFYDVLSLSGISGEFAKTCISEFILYWKETGQAHNSWNSKFLQHVKYQWQRQQSFGSNEDLEKRIDASWTGDYKKISDKTTDPDALKKGAERLKKLKEKHGI